MKRQFLKAVLLAGVMASTIAMAGEPFMADVTICSVRDGDTADACEAFKDDHTGIRVFGIDTPEKSQSGGLAAKDFFSGLVLGQKVTLRCTGEKTYNRHVCKIYRGGVDIGAMMVQSGWAYDVPKFSRGEYAQLQSEAMERGLGVFQTLKTPKRHRQGE